MRFKDDDEEKEEECGKGVFILFFCIKIDENFFFFLSSASIFNNI
jgi:hypothetical protein